MRILIITDAWKPQINGVVRTLETTAALLCDMGHQVEITGPEAHGWRSVAAPSYPSIKLEFFARRRLAAIVTRFNPDCIHIATEGPLGWAARNLCLRQHRPFTTSYHTRFPEYLAARVIPPLRHPVRSLVYSVLRRFHAPSAAVMVATASIESELQARRFRRIVRWSRGVDTGLFRPRDDGTAIYAGLQTPIMLYVGRVATEKNIEAFLTAQIPGSKIVIGDGPDLAALSSAWPGVRFLGAMEGEQLARHYAAADLFVFPSLTDTFGLVLLEAAAAGLRIACLPAPGPLDIFAGAEAEAFTALDPDMETAMRRALGLPRDPALPRRFAEGFSWKFSARQFLHHLQATTPQATRRVARFKSWLGRWWQRALALKAK